MYLLCSYYQSMQLYQHYHLQIIILNHELYDLHDHHVHDHDDDLL